MAYILGHEVVKSRQMGRRECWKTSNLSTFRLHMEHKVFNYVVCKVLRDHLFIKCFTLTCSFSVVLLIEMSSKTCKGVSGPAQAIA